MLTELLHKNGVLPEEQAIIQALSSAEQVIIRALSSFLAEPDAGNQYAALVEIDNVLAPIHDRNYVPISFPVYQALRDVLEPFFQAENFSNDPDVRRIAMDVYGLTEAIGCDIQIQASIQNLQSNVIDAFGQASALATIEASLMPYHRALLPVHPVLMTPLLAEIVPLCEHAAADIALPACRILARSDANRLVATLQTCSVEQQTQRIQGIMPLVQEWLFESGTPAVAVGYFAALPEAFVQAKVITPDIIEQLLDDHATLAVHLIQLHARPDQAGLLTADIIQSLCLSGKAKSVINMLRKQPVEVQRAMLAPQEVQLAFFAYGEPSKAVQAFLQEFPAPPTSPQRSKPAAPSL
jgi:hypothetical protein